MTEEGGANRTPRPRTDERARGQDEPSWRPSPWPGTDWERDFTLAWVSENVTMVRRSAFGPRVLYKSLGISLAVGLAAHVGGFVLESWATTEPLLLMADLLYTLGWALWTGVVVAVFLQIYPETRKRGFKQLLDAYEAAVGDQPQRKREGTSR